MGYRFNRLDEPVFMTVSKPLLTEFGIHHILESCVPEWVFITLLTWDAGGRFHAMKPFWKLEEA